MSTIINATTTNGVVIQPDNSGSLQLKTNNGTTAVTIDTSQNVGIGTTSPNGKFESYANSGYSVIANSSAGSVAINPSSNAIVFGTTNVAAYATGNYDAATHVYKTSGTERMRIDSSGRITTPYQPAFFVNKTTQTNLTSTDSVIIYDNITTNIGSCYNASNGRFTAPIAGFYQFNIVNTLYSSSGSTYNAVYPLVNGSYASVYQSIRSRGAMINGNYSGINGSFSIYLNASDYMEMWTYAQSTSYLYAGEQIFSGYLIG